MPEIEWDPADAFRAREQSEELRKSQATQELWVKRVQGSPLSERWPEVIDIARARVDRMNESSLGPRYEAIVNPEEFHFGAHHTICIFEQGKRGPTVQLYGIEESSEGRIFLGFLPDRYIPPLHYDKFEFAPVDPELDPSSIETALEFLIRSDGYPADRPRPKYDSLNHWKGVIPPDWEEMTD